MGVYCRDQSPVGAAALMLLVAPCASVNVGAACARPRSEREFRGHGSSPTSSSSMISARSGSLPCMRGRQPRGCHCWPSAVARGVARLQPGARSDDRARHASARAAGDERTALRDRHDLRPHVGPRRGRRHGRQTLAVVSSPPRRGALVSGLVVAHALHHERRPYPEGSLTMGRIGLAPLTQAVHDRVMLDRDL